MPSIKSKLAVRTDSEDEQQYETMQSNVVQDAISYLKTRLRKLGRGLLSSDDAKDLCILELSAKDREVFLVLHLDSGLNLIKVEHVCEGTINSNTVYIRNLMESVIKFKSAHILVAHNHPSQNMEWSQEDIRLTRTLVGAFKPFGVNVMDHILVGGVEAVSLRDCDVHNIWRKDNA